MGKETQAADIYLRKAEELAAEFAKDAVERDKAGGTPKRQRDLIRESGLLKLIIPSQYGGDNQRGRWRCASFGSSPSRMHRWPTSWAIIILWLCRRITRARWSSSGSITGRQSETTGSGAIPQTRSTVT